MPRRLNDQIVVKPAVEISTGPAAAALVSIPVDATGYSRARFVVSLKPNGNSASLSTGLGVWQASTSGATYALISGASAAAITSGLISGGANNNVVIDVPVSSANPWMQLSGSIVGSGAPHHGTVELYSGVNRPPTHSELSVVVV